MRNRLLLALILICGTTTLTAQVQGNTAPAGFVEIDPVFLPEAEYYAKKAAGTLTGNEVPIPSTMVNPGDLDQAKHYVKYVNLDKATGCAGYTDPVTPPATGLPVNADDFTLTQVPLPFSYCFYGTNYTSVFFNSNGNVSFGTGITTYTSNAFPSTGNAMVAAFWADFDFGNGTATYGTMHYTVTPTAAIFNWVNAGYFNDMTDKRNTCQIVLTDGNDPLVLGGNTAIHYDDMQWTTGGASGGTGGFGGTPATAGVNRGNNLNYFTIGRFDHAGTDYDGPGGANDGVSFLDNKSYYLNLCNASGNLEPIALQTAYCDTSTICNIGGFVDISFPFIGPENNQTVTVSYSAPTLNNIQVVSNNANELTLRIFGDQETPGYHTITITATDDAGVPLSTIIDYTFEIVDGSNVFTVIPTLNYVNSCDEIELAYSPDIPNENFIWSTGATTPTAIVTPSTDGIVGVTFNLSGCTLVVDTNITVYASIPVDRDGSLFFCPALGGTQITYPDSLSYSDISWGLSDPGQDSLFTNFLTEGFYTVSLTQNGGSCIYEDTFTISSQPPLHLVADTGSCNGIIDLNGNTGGSGVGVWSVVPGAPGTVTFNPPSSLNPTVILSNLGTYYVVYTDANCGDDDTIQLIYAPTPSFNFTNDFFTCPGIPEPMTYNDSVNLVSIDWDNGQGPGTEYNAQLNVGQYTVMIETVLGCKADTTFDIVSQPLINIDDLITNVCGDYLDFNNNTGIPVGQWTTYSSPGTVSFSNPTDLNSDLHISNYGTYHLVFTESTCNDADTATILFTPYPYVDLSETQEICVGQFIDVVATDAHPNFTTDIYWNTGAGVNTINIGTPGQYYVTVENACGSYTDSIMVISTVCDINLPNVITPNGDNMNDEWGLLAVANIFKSFDCFITDRWGTTVYSSNDPAGKWNGKDKAGNTLSEGVYFYVITFTTLADEEKVKNGFIHIEK